MKTELSGKEYEFSIWNDETLNPALIAMDTETSVVERPLIPELALTTASDGKLHVIIPNNLLSAFLTKHAKARFVFYNVSFDFWVINEFLRSSSRMFDQGSNILWLAAEENRLHDYMLLDMLYRLAVNDFFPVPRNLGEASKHYANLSIDKEDPYRMRYAEILNQPLEAVDPGFLDYAIKDTIATWLGFINLYTKAKKLAYDYGISSYVLKEHGLFTESIQVKAAISLTKITNNGIKLDTTLSREMHQEIEGIIWKVVNELDTEYPTDSPTGLKKDIKQGLFKRSAKTGNFELTENNIPKISRTKLSEIFVQVAERLNRLDGVKVVTPKTAKGKISTSMPLWGDYIQLDDFLTKWEIWSENTKAAQFFSKLDKEEIFPRYKYFVRTGRTSQQDPNCVDGVTEVLTPYGWQSFSSILDSPTTGGEASGVPNDLEIMQFDPFTKELTFCKPQWIKNKAKLWININSNNLSMRVTPDHRCLSYTGDEPYDILADDIGNRYSVPRSGIYNPKPPEAILLSDKDLELLAILLTKFKKEGSEYKYTVFWQKKYILKALMFQNPNVFKYSENKEEKTCTLTISESQVEHLEDVCGGEITSEKVEWVFGLYFEELKILYNKLEKLKYKGILNDILELTTHFPGVAYNVVTKKAELIEEGENCYCVTVPTGYFVARRTGNVFITGNCQQIKKGRMREIIVPREGYALVAADYSFIELRTLACIMERLFKKSVMADVIREGKDPHAWSGAMLVNMEYEEFCELKKTKPDFYDKWRQNSKALNFGIPGGLGAPSLLNYAKNIYHIKDWTIETAKTFRDKICNEVYPELGKYLEQDGMRIMCEALGCNMEDAWNLFEIQGERSPFIINCIKNVIKGEPFKKDGTKYNDKFIDKIWENLQNLNSNPSLSTALRSKAVGLDLVKKLCWTSTGTLTGRVRGKVSFTQSKNCLDAKTEALTKRGWVKGFDLTMEDQILTKNINTGNLEWQKPTDLKFYPDYEGPLVQFKTKNFNAVSTPDHRWLVYNKCTGKDECKTTNKISVYGDNRIHRTGNYIAPEKEIFTNDFVEIIAWYLTDGCGRLVKRKTVEDYIHVQLFQSERANLEKVKRIEKALNNENMLNSTTLEIDTELRRFYLKREHAENIFKLFPGRVLNVDFMLKLTKTQLSLLLNTMIDGDGCRSGGKIRFHTKSKESSDLFQMLCTLNNLSSTATLRDMSKYKPKSKKLKNIPKMGNIYIVNVLKRDKVQIQKQHKTEYISKEPIWCPMVPNTYFVARRENQVFITGNTPFQGLAADGAKLAVYTLVKNESIYGYKVVNFVHDECVFEVPDLGGYVDKHIVDYILSTMCKEMEKVTPGMPIAGEYTVARSWTKKNKNMRVEGDRVYF